MRPRLPPGPDIQPRELAEGEELTVFRIVRSDDANAEEFLASFLSRAALGLPPRGGTPEETHPLLREGISVYERRQAAEETARRVRAIGRDLGDFVAELHLTPEVGARFLRWGARGHLTVWCDPIKLTGAVVDTIRIGEGAGEGADNAVHDPR